MRVLRRLLLVLLIMGAVGAGGWWLYRTRFAPQADTATGSYSQVAAVQRGDVSASISVVGALAAVRQQDLYFDRLSGTTALLSLSVQAGYVVLKGDQLASIDPSPYAQALDQAQSDLQEADEAFADLQTPPTELQIARADLSIAQAELKLQEARKALEDLQDRDTDDAQDALSDAQNALAQAKLQQTLTESDSLVKRERELLYAVDWHERKITELQMLVSTGRANVEQTEELGGEQEDLVESRSELARVQSQRQLALQVAGAEVVAAEAAVAEAENGLTEAAGDADELDIAKAELAISEAEVALAEAEEKRSDLDAGVDVVDLAAARASVDKKRLTVSERQADLEATTILAPFAGTVLRVDRSAGQLINKTSRILTIADLDEMQVQAAVDETTVRQVQVGQQAVITFDAFPGQEFQGEVLSIPLQGTLQGDVMVYQVPVSLEGAEELPLLVGMTANVLIAVGHAEGVLLVPTMALLNNEGFYQVLLPGGSDPESSPQAVPVEVGISDGVYSEVIRGLNEGDQVIVQVQASDATEGLFGAIRMMGGMGGGVRTR
jgi:HlyD family secretion protein